MQHFLAFFIGEGNVVELHVPFHRRHDNGTLRVLVFAHLMHDFARPLESGNGLGQLRSYAYNLENRGDQER